MAASHLELKSACLEILAIAEATNQEQRGWSTPSVSTLCTTGRRPQIPCGAIGGGECCSNTKRQFKFETMAAIAVDSRAGESSSLLAVADRCVGVGLTRGSRSQPGPASRTIWYSAVPGSPCPATAVPSSRDAVGHRPAQSARRTGTTVSVPHDSSATPIRLHLEQG